MAKKTLDDFKEHVMIDVFPCPEPVAERAIRNTLIEFCEKTHILTREFTVTLSNEASINTSLTDSIDIELSDYVENERPVSVLGFNKDGVPYVPEFRNITGDIPDSVWEDIHSDNRIYFNFPDNYILRVFDMESTDVYLHVVLAVKPLRSAESVDDILYEDWLDAIVAGVKFRLLAMPNKEWTDKKGSNVYYTEWRRGISRARAKVHKAYSRHPQEVNPAILGRIDWD